MFFKSLFSQNNYNIEGKWKCDLRESENKGEAACFLFKNGEFDLVYKYLRKLCIFPPLHLCERKISE